MLFKDCVECDTFLDFHTGSISVHSDTGSTNKFYYISYLQKCKIFDSGIVR